MTRPRKTSRSHAVPRLRLVPRRQPESIRWTKVMTAQARIAVGYYDREDVKQQVLEAVLRELSRP
jgi:hypothetical protein